MAIPIREKYEEYARYAAHCLNTLTIAKDAGIAHHSSPNGGRMDEAGRCRSAALKARAYAIGVKTRGQRRSRPRAILASPIGRWQLLRQSSQS